VASTRATSLGNIKYAVIDGAGAGNNTVVSAATGKKIRVLSYVLVNGHTSTQTVRFESGADGTALSGQMIIGANGILSAGFNEGGWFETAAGSLLNLELAGATTVDGHLSYIEAD
jgi:hypothetical protein